MDRVAAENYLTYFPPPIAPPTPPRRDVVPPWGLTRQIVETNVAGRNKPCPCGSGLKFKGCCQRTLKALNVVQSMKPIPPTQVLRQPPPEEKQHVAFVDRLES